MPEKVPLERCQFTDGKVSKVRWMGQNSTDFATGTWDQVENRLSIWTDSFDNDENLVRSHSLIVDSNIEDLICLNRDKLLFSTGAGDVQMATKEEESLKAVHIWERLYNFGSASCLSVMSTDVLCGGSDGRLLKLDINCPNTITVVAEDCLSSIHSLAHSTQNEVLSGHTTGQLFCWDTRLDLGHFPCLSISGANLRTAITSLAVHPAQSNLVAFGTQRGTVGFCDVRRPSQELMDQLAHPFAIASGPVWEIKFDPLYPDNFFSCTEDGTLLHWDVACLKESAISVSGTRPNVWLLGPVLHDATRLTNLLSNQSLSVNSFDLINRVIVAGTDSETVHSLTLM